ncbi:DUF2510 domain-containing protein [Mycolicibacterium lutetiense]|uniref:DUF2510 domain-containing protein n=1 Tax=Mycolicibacterium lutetiense TaxID=1641992 RepID=A0ABS4ZWG7_9MYCO|nr:DUF2510 domain-containing protein [Mycolicibacterium lutetiense]MBP2453867.1 hypothetical protein [Mycolicibacterium lutetiense]
MNAPQPAPGWYPDPSDAGNRIYWNGSAWIGPASTPTATENANKGKRAAVAAGVCVLVVIGLVMSMQSVSLLTGSGPVWTGVAVVAAGTAVAFFLGAARWVRIVAAVLLALALVNAIYIENEMSDKRNEISRMFDQ